MASITLVFLPSGTCLPKKEFEAHCESLQSLELSILSLLAKIAWNPRERPLLPDQSVLKEKGILTAQGQLPFTLAEILKGCYDPQNRSWNTENLQTKQTAPAPPPARRQRNPLPIVRPNDAPPSPQELSKLLRQVKGNNAPLRELIARGGLKWIVEDYWEKGTTVKSWLCKTALHDRDSSLLEALFPYFSEQEIEILVENNISTVFEEPGLLLLKAHPRPREIVLRETLPGSRYYLSRSKAVQMFLNNEEAEMVAQRKFPIEFLQQLFLWRLRVPEYQNWCFSILESRTRERLNKASVFEELLKCPPSRHRSEMALRATACLDYIHDSLKEKAFCFQKPDDTPNLVYHCYKSIDIYLHRLQSRKDKASLLLIKDNFLFLLCNKNGIAMFNTFLR